MFYRWCLALGLLAGLAGCNSGSSSSSDSQGVASAASQGAQDSGENQAREFDEPSQSQIRPGVIINSDQGSCTSNFLYRANEATYYIGTAAHCFSPDSNSGDPCEARNENIGFNNVGIENASQPGTLVYSSWVAMQQRGEVPGSDICRYNDFALVEIHADDLDNIHPAAIRFGGPTALFKGTAAVGDTVYSYGRSPFHAGVEDLETKEGSVTAILAGGLAYNVRNDNSGLSGDSGSAVLHEDGRALGVLSTVVVFPDTGSNGVVNLQRALNYATAGGFIPASTAVLTWPDFDPSG